MAIQAMTPKARITFYSIDRCGYYRRGNEEAEFGRPPDILSQLKDWVKGRELRETCTFAVEESAYLNPTYVVSLEYSDEEYLLTTWNEVPSTDNRVPNLDLASRVGSPKIRLATVPEDAVAGYPTYFWFIPRLNVFATVVFLPQKLNGRPGMAKLLEEFIAKFSRFVVVNDETNETEVLGYRDPDQGDPADLEKLYPWFRSSMLTHSNTLDLIRKNRNDISKIVRKNRLSFEVSDPGSLIGSMLDVLGIATPQIRKEEIKVKYEIDHCPTEDELESIISNWNESAGSRWDDVGFKFRSEGTNTYWLSGGIVRKEEDLDVTPRRNTLMEPKLLIQALQQKRRKLLRGVRRG